MIPLRYLRRRRRRRYRAGSTTRLAPPPHQRGCATAIGSVIAGSAGVIGMIGASSDDINPIAFPVSHIGGAAMLAASLLTGMRLVLFDTFDPVPDAEGDGKARRDDARVGHPFFRRFHGRAACAWRGTAVRQASRVCRWGRADHRGARTPSARDAFGCRRRKRVGLDRVSGRHVTTAGRIARGA